MIERLVPSLNLRLEYSFVIPHDVETLIKFMGGGDTFEKRLDLMVRFIHMDILMRS